MPKQLGFWSVEDRLRELSARDDPLEKLVEIIDFELFRPVLDEVVGVADRSEGGRPPFDAVLTFKMPELRRFAPADWVVKKPPRRRSSPAR